MAFELLLEATAAKYDTTDLAGVHSLTYRIGVQPIPGDGEGNGKLGEFRRGLNRCSGFFWSFDANIAEILLATVSNETLTVWYTSLDGDQRKRVIQKVLWLGDARVTFPNVNTGLGSLIGVPFRVQFPKNADISDRISDSSA